MRTTTRLRGAVIGALVGCAALLPPDSLAGQTVRGTVIDAQSKEPVLGAIVVLLDGSDVRRAATLTEESGSYFLTAPAPGRYRVRVERIGLQSTTSPPIDLAAGVTVEHSLEASPAAVPLAALRASARSKCSLRPGDGLKTSGLYEEARKALTANQLTIEERMFGVEMTHFDRELDPRSLRVTKESRRTIKGLTENPVVSRPAEELAETGYMKYEGGEFWYYGPDAGVLLSDSFLDGHCFRVEEKHADDASLIGLFFEPEKDQKRPDIRGVLWLDRSTSELRYLEYAYTNLPPMLRSRHVGGRVDFRRLPTGHWIVDRWSIRMPLVAVEQRSFSRPDGSGILEQRADTTIRAIAEQGGEVTAVLGRGAAWTRGDGAVISGVVFDSSRAIPLAGASVFLSGTQHSTTSDSTGAYRLDALPTKGEYTLSFLHPQLNALGVVGTARPVALEAGLVDTIDLFVPSQGAILGSSCPDSLRGESHGMVRGVIRDARTGEPLIEQKLSISWSRPAVAAGQVTRRDVTASVVTDRGGAYTLCGVPTDRVVQVRARAGQRPTELRFADGSRLLLHELLLAVPSSVMDETPPLPRINVADVTASSPPEAGARLTGIVRDTSGRAIGDAQLRIAQTGALAISDADGRFRFTALPAGAYTLEARALGHRSESVELTLRDRSATEVALALDIVPGVLAATQVRAPAAARDLTGFEERRRQGRGQFLTREDIEKRASLGFTDLMRAVPGVQVRAVQMADVVGTKYVVQVDRIPRGVGVATIRPGSNEDATPVEGAGVLACEPAYYVDGNEFIPSRTGIDYDLRAAEIEAIEVYRTIEAPPQFQRRSNCGVILIWTRSKAVYPDQKPGSPP